MTDMSRKKGAQTRKSYAIDVSSLDTSRKECRNQRFYSDSKWGELSKSTKEEAGKQKRDNPSSETKVFERNNKSVRQTRFEEVPDYTPGSLDDSSYFYGSENKDSRLF